MADALVLVTSILQVADVGLRTSLGLYAFFTALHKAKPEFSRYLIVLRDVHDSLRLLQKWVLDCPADTVLDEDGGSALRRQLVSITDELSSIENITAGKDPSKPTGKLRWVLKKPEVERKLLRLESHKTSLLILLQAVDMRKTAQLLQAQTSLGAKVCSLEARIEQQGKLYQQSLEDSFASLARGIHGSDTDAGYAVRRALEVYLQPMLENELATIRARDDTKRAAEMRGFCAILNQASSRIDSHISLLESRNKLPPNHAMEPSQPIPPRHCSAMQDYRGLGSLGAISSHHFDAATISRGVYPVPAPRCEIPIGTSEWSYWANIRRVGTFRLRYWLSAGPRGKVYNFTACFWPSSTVIFKTAFSLKYSNRHDAHGYLPLFPSLAIFPVLPRDDPVWEIIRQDDLPGLMARFSQKLNTLFDEDAGGVTLLMCASRNQSYKIVEFLLRYGVDPMRLPRDLLYGTSSQALAAMVLFKAFQAFTGRVSSSNGPDDADLQAFRYTVRLLVAAGCDINSFSPGTAISMAMNKENGPKRMWGDGTRSQYLNRVTHLAEILSQEGYDMLSWLDRSVLVMVLHRPCARSLPVLRAVGLTGGCSPSSDKPACSNAVLYLVLEACAMAISGGKQQISCLAAGENLVDVLVDGCNLYDVGWLHNNPSLNRPITPTLVAEELGITATWRWALMVAGFDVAEVFAEDARRVRWFRLQKGAKSSGVDMQGSVLQGSIRRRPRGAGRRWASRKSPGTVPIYLDAGGKTRKTQ
ncbi:hypothetical protein GGTG_07255, partial [Gaeumannomyces tritici R3-111a-1]